MAVPASLDLDTALRRSGEPGDARFAAVTVRRVPRPIARVWGSGIEAMALPRVVLTSNAAFDRIVDGSAADLLVHESVHIDQWRDHGVVGFAVQYLSDYVRGRAIGLPHHTAYRAIRFEREAARRTGQV